MARCFRGALNGQVDHLNASSEVLWSHAAGEIRSLRRGISDLVSALALSASELDQRVAQRSRELAAAVEELQLHLSMLQKRAQDELRDAQAELEHVTRVMTVGELTASIAHEVNQPLCGIVTNASTCLRMLAGSPPNVDGARETVRRTLRDAHRASELITRLRGLFARKDIAAESVDLNEAAREVISLCSAALQRNRVVLRTELAGELPTVTGDRVQLQQVLLNLLTNASDAMTGIDDRPRDLLLRTALDEAGLVRVTVSDTGSGFRPEDAERLCTAFYTTKSGGMGIGLSISRSIIESHGGRLWAECNPGPGATFSFCIPCAPVRAARHPADASGYDGRRQSRCQYQASAEHATAANAKKISSRHISARVTMSPR